MPRHQRKLSNTSIYHIMLRGNERKKIFESSEEKQRLLEDISIKQKEFEFSRESWGRFEVGQGDRSLVTPQK